MIITDIMAGTYFLVVTYPYLLLCSFSQQARYDHLFGDAAAEENWIGAMRREKAYKKILAEYSASIPVFTDIRTVEACDQALAVLRVSPDEDAVMREERERYRVDMIGRIEAKRRVLVERSAKRQVAADAVPFSTPGDKARFGWMAPGDGAHCVMKVPKLTNAHAVVTNILEYDFMQGEFLPPHGRGKVADAAFLFVRNGMYGTNAQTTCDCRMVRFAGEENGVAPIPVENPKRPFHPYELLARDWGLESDLKWTKDVRSSVPCTVRLNQGKGYQFRIRTRRDDNGNIHECYYGVVWCGFEMTTRQRRDGDVEECGVDFNYMLKLRPADRNLGAAYMSRMAK